MYSRDKIIATMREIYEESKQIKPYVVIAQPRRSKDEVPAQKFDGYEGIHIDLLGFSHGFCDIYGEKVDVARNYLIEQAIESGAKYLLFIGEDTVVPYDGFKKLHDLAEANPNAVVTGVYYIKCSDAMIMTKEDDYIVIPNVDPGQVIEAWQTGMDIMLIPISILKAMKEEEPELPFCCIGSGLYDDIPFIGEDNFFVYRLRKRGTKLLVNTDVQCLHMDLATGMYTSHPSTDSLKYYTNIKPTRRLTIEDKDFIDHRWISRIPKGTGAQEGHDALIAKLVEEGKPVKFNMGCGEDRREGYIGIDKHSKTADIQADLFDVQLPDNCADEILASHVIEHLPQHRAPEMLTKWFNVLKPGGKLIMEQPDLEALCKDFLTQEGVEKHMTAMCIFGAIVTSEICPEIQKNGVLSPHLWGYTPKTLSDLCEAVGFKHIQVLPATGGHPGKNFRLEAIKEAA